MCHCPHPEIDDHGATQWYEMASLNDGPLSDMVQLSDGPTQCYVPTQWYGPNQ